MAEDTFRVILKGYGTSKGEHYIEEDLAKLFKISQEKAKEILNACPKTVKDNLDLEKANKYKDAIDQTGAKCEVENMKYNISGLSLT